MSFLTHQCVFSSWNSAGAEQLRPMVISKSNGSKYHWTQYGVSYVLMLTVGRLCLWSRFYPYLEQYACQWSPVICCSLRKGLASAFSVRTLHEASFPWLTHPVLPPSRHAPNPAVNMKHPDTKPHFQRDLGPGFPFPGLASYLQKSPEFWCQMAYHPLSEVT